MKLIAAVDKNWAIGRHNHLLVSIPADQRYFRDLTIGHTVLMGRTTFESLPGGMPLPGRINLVLTSQADYDGRGAAVAHSVEEALRFVENTKGDRETYVIGGGSIYQQMLPFCDTAFITKIEFDYQADVYAPNLDENTDWKVRGISEEQTYYDLEYHFYRYERV